MHAHAEQGEKRKRIRVNFNHPVKLVSPRNDWTIDAETIDLSLNGMLVKTNQAFGTAQKCMVEITLPLAYPKVNLKISAHVVRMTDKGVAITFDQMDLETLVHLQQIVLRNSQDPDEMVRQIKTRPGFK